MPPLLIEEEMDAINTGDELYDDPMSTEMLENIRVWIQPHMNIMRKEARYKMRDRIKQKQSEWKWALKSTRNMGNSLHKVF